jgi:hypothetical protein
VTPETSRQVQTLQVCGGSGWHQRKSAPLKKEHPLALLACGLFCYGLYCLLEARYRDLTPGR